MRPARRTVSGSHLEDESRVNNEKPEEFMELHVGLEVHLPTRAHLSPWAHLTCSTDQAALEQ